LKLGTKLLLAPLLTGVIALTGGGINALLMDRNAVANAEAFKTDLANLRTISQAQEQVGRTHAGTYRMVALIASMDEPAIKAFRADLKKQIDEVARVVTTVAGQAGQTEALGTSVKAIEADLGRYVKQADNAIDMASVDPNTGVVAMQSADATFKSASKHMANIVNGIEATSAQAGADSTASARRNTLLLTLGGVLATAVALAFSAAMLRRVIRSLQQAAAVAVEGPHPAGRCRHPGPAR
jgi:hypothetical protein